MRVSPELAEAERIMAPLISRAVSDAVTAEAAWLDAEIMGGAKRHYYWPSEFPVALCGHLSRFSTWTDARQAGAGRPLCAECIETASRLLADAVRYDGGCSGNED